MGDRIVMAHSSLSITRILGKRNTGGICHPSCTWAQLADGTSIRLDMTSHIVRSGVFTPRGMGVL